MPNFGGTAVTGNGSWTWGITNNAEDPAATAKLLEFLLEDDKITALTDKNGAVPSTMSAMAASKLFADGGALNVFTQQLSKGVALPRPAHPA